MPVQLDPPGHLAVHLEIVALTPVLLCWAGACAGAIVGAGRAARAFVAIGIALGLGLLLLDLRQRGFALAVDRVIGREWFPAGIARVSWPTMALAACAGIHALISALRRNRALPAPRDGWYCGLAICLALVPIPVLVTGCAWDAPATPTKSVMLSRRATLIAMALAMTVVAWLTASPWPHAVTAALGACLCRPARVPLIIAAVAACWPIIDAGG